jgi:hypothetical protein
VCDIILEKLKLLFLKDLITSLKDEKIRKIDEIIIKLDSKL